MVTIITGKMNSGKTTRIKNIFEHTEEGDGFISRKIMIGTDVYGFNAIRLSDGFEFPFMIHERYYYDESIFSDDTGFAYIYEIGPYKVLKYAIEFIDGTYLKLIEKMISPLYFDEVGLLEVKGLGYAKHILSALNNKLDIIITAREDLILDIIEFFDITKYEIRR